LGTRKAGLAEAGPEYAARNERMTTDTGRPKSLLRVWATAVRPFAYTGSVLPVVLGTVLAHHQRVPMHWGRFALALLGVVFFHTAANLLNDCFDHRRGVDTEVVPTSGAVVRGWLTERQVAVAAVVCLLCGTACGLLLVWMAGWVVLLLGAIGAILAVGYTLPGACFKYAGLGDLDVFLAFGAVPMLGAYWVQAEVFSWVPLVWSLPLVSFTVGILHANNWRDIGSDTGKGCRTFASALGMTGSGVYYRILMLAPFALVVLYWLLGWCVSAPVAAPVTVLLVLVLLPKALRLSGIRAAAEQEAFAMLDARTAQLHLMFGVLLTVAFIAARYLLPVGA